MMRKIIVALVIISVVSLVELSCLTTEGRLSPGREDSGVTDAVEPEILLPVGVEVDPSDVPVGPLVTR